ncbi:ABC transporter permease [Endozoicomonas montiporae]|uniref:ABC transporter permease n=2 Tax=Endozoicomonas montiporae TaxID=1027273 RepID=A0A081N5I8_9GAMM|nr:amino acid ABC transporter permease [Endozoicomonas montiporae]AMO57397.1 putative amino-acid transport system permease protein [Endozoicomonas montiporae CL-33]KEQ13711.1 ABC transporter permease [Endozoicomonas montiporae]
MIDFDYTVGLLPTVTSSLDATLWMTLGGLALSLSMGLVLALIKVTRPFYLHYLADLYISFFRGSPLLVQLFIFYYGLPQVFPAMRGMPAIIAVIIGLGLHFSAYMAESMRAAIIGIHHGQMEAALSVGMSRMQAMRRIILPQAARVAFPGLMNNTIDLLKSTSLAFTLGVVEIMARAQMEASSSFRFFESYLTVALVYWLVVVLCTWFQKWAEARLNRAYA